MGARVVDSREEPGLRSLQSLIHSYLCIGAHSFVRDELAAELSLADQPDHPFAHLVNGVLIADVVAFPNLLDATMQVPRSEWVAGDKESAF